MGERVLSNEEIRKMSKDYNPEDKWDGVERRKGRSMVPEEMERRRRDS